MEITPDQREIVDRVIRHAQARVAACATLENGRELLRVLPFAAAQGSGG